jgi:hypothetical protein
VHIKDRICLTFTIQYNYSLSVVLRGAPSKKCTQQIQNKKKSEDHDKFLSASFPAWPAPPIEVGVGVTHSLTQLLEATSSSGVALHCIIGIGIAQTRHPYLPSLPTSLHRWFDISIGGTSSSSPAHYSILISIVE